MAGHSFYHVFEHIVFSTKDRMALITPAVEKELHSYLAATIRNMGCECWKIGGRIEHVHILVRKSSTLLTPELIKEVKRSSSKWIKTKGEAWRDFHWQRGYGAFSVSYSLLENVRQYIVNQPKHHQNITWEDEFRALLIKNGIEFDERYFLD
jgi:REP element-mobilizing transposase RayT